MIGRWRARSRPDKLAIAFGDGQPDVPGSCGHRSPLQRLREMVDWATTAPRLSLLGRGPESPPPGEPGLSFVHPVGGRTRCRTHGQRMLPTVFNAVCPADAQKSHKKLAEVVARRA